MIREATEADVPSIVALGGQSLVDGPYAGMLKNTPEQSAKLALETIKGTNGKVLLLDEGEGPVGLLGFIVFPHYFTGELTATEIMWYVLPGSRRGGGGLKLMWEAEKKAKAMGATRMGFTAPTAEVAEIYKRSGYKAIETTYMKEL